MEAGTPDILACIPVVIDEAHADGIGLCSEERTVGLFVGIETKMPGKESTVTSIQEHRHNQIRAAGGVVIVATSVQQVVQELGLLGWDHSTNNAS